MCVLALEFANEFQANFLRTCEFFSAYVASDETSK